MKDESRELVKKILWDYNISLDKVVDVIDGKREYAGHYNREKLFIKVLESFSWTTVLDIFSLSDVKELLTPGVVSKLRTPSLRDRYDNIRKKLQSDD